MFMKRCFDTRALRVPLRSLCAGDDNEGGDHTAPGRRDELALDGRLFQRTDAAADVRPDDPSVCAGGYVQQDHACDLPAAIRYVDLGSADLLAAKADGTENVLRVKAALRDFSRESNLSVITEDGAYYTFNVKYADEPQKLSVEMTDFCMTARL